MLNFVIFANGQDSYIDISNELDFYKLQKELIPLEQLLDSAEVNSPLLKIIDADILIQELRIKSEKKEWLSYFSVSGTAKYGMFDNLVISELEAGADDYLGSTNTKQTRYSVGLAVKVPFSSIFDKYNRDAAINEKAKLHYQRDNTISELRKLVISQYGNLMAAQNKLVARTSELETVKLEMADVELNFKNGQIPISAYTKQKSKLLNLQLLLEEIKIEFKVALYHLQETVGIDLNLNSTI